MIIPRPTDAVHKAWLYRVLTAIADESDLTSLLKFKGGTCAAMLGYLDRFSIDLDFDASVLSRSAVQHTRESFAFVFRELGLSVKQQSKVGIQFFCQYEARARQRNTIKIEVQYPAPTSNVYHPSYFSEIDRTLVSQTVETMFANKLVAVLDRWEKNHSIAGRDIYDIHHFFLQGYRYLPTVIEERRQQSLPDFFQSLIDFVEKKISDQQLQQDLNTLLPYDRFRRVHGTLKQETLMLLRDEFSRLDPK